MHSIAIRRTKYGALLALIMMAAGLAEAGPRLNPQPWKWLVNQATVLTTAGIGWVIDKLNEDTQSTADYVAWGTGAGTAAVGDTTLFTEDSGGSPAYARIVATRTKPQADTIQWVAALTANGTKTITNAGNFTALTAGTLINKGDFIGTLLNTNDIMQITIKLQQT